MSSNQRAEFNERAQGSQGRGDRTPLDPEIVRLRRELAAANRQINGLHRHINRLDKKTQSLECRITAMRLNAAVRTIDLMSERLDNKQKHEEQAMRMRFVMGLFIAGFVIIGIDALYRR